MHLEGGSSFLTCVSCRWDESPYGCHRAPNPSLMPFGVLKVPYWREPFLGQTCPSSVAPRHPLPRWGNVFISWSFHIDLMSKRLQMFQLAPFDVWTAINSVLWLKNAANSWFFLSFYIPPNTVPVKHNFHRMFFSNLSNI